VYIVYTVHSAKLPLPQHDLDLRIRTGSVNVLVLKTLMYLLQLYPAGEGVLHTSVPSLPRLLPAGLLQGEASHAQG